MKTLLSVALLAAAAAVPASAAVDRSDEDLAAVKKAVASAPAQAAAPAATARPKAEEEPARVAPRSHGAEAKWFRVRIVEKAGKRGRVSINLPLVFVRAFADDWPVQGCRRCANGRGPTIGEVLRALDSGQSLFEVDDDEASVRVWID